MENKAKIVWIDDEYQSLQNIELGFYKAGIEFVGFEDALKAINYLKVHYEQIDALVVDGNFFIHEDDVSIDRKGKALSLVLDSLRELKHKKDIPYYVLSGQLNFRNREAPILDYKDIAEVYDKLKPEHLENLCTRILQDSLSNPKRQIINKYKSVFEVVSSFREPKILEDNLVNILQGIEHNDNDFTGIRKIIEGLFFTLGDLGIIPEDLILEKGWINGTSLFLSRKHSGYDFSEEVTHPIIADSVFRLLCIVQDASHSEGALKLRVDQFLNYQNTGYLYQSTIYLLLEVLVYFGDFMMKNNDVNRNKQLWKKKDFVESKTSHDWREGTIKQIAENGWGTFICNDTLASISIPPIKVNEYILTENQKIKVRVEPNGDGSKLHIKEITIE